MSKKFFRIGAFLIDASLFNSLITFIISPFLVEVKMGMDLLQDIFVITILLTVYIILISLYGVVTNKFFSGTIGKVLLGIKVTDDKGFKILAGTSFNREIMKWGYMYATLGIYGVWCLYKLFNDQSIYHDVKNHTKVS
ncbi:MAG: RDD family protein [Mycoplasmatales bacterium]